MSDITAPAIWGPTAWYLIHHVTKNLVKLNPPDVQKNEYLSAVEDFLTSLLLLIPCSICQNHFRENLMEDPPYQHFETWAKLDKWGHNLHNKVNQMLKKPSLPYLEYQNMYQRKQSKKMIKFSDIIYQLHVEPSMSLSEIQEIKTFLNALVVLYPSGNNPAPTPRSNSSIQKNKGIIKDIYNYDGLNDFYQQFLRNGRFL